MATDIYAMPDLKKKVKKRDRDRRQKRDTGDSGQSEEVRGQEEETLVDIYGNVDHFRSSEDVSGPQEDTAGSQTLVIYASPVLTKKVSQRDGDRGQTRDTDYSGQLEEVRGEEEETVVDIYDNIRISEFVSGPQEDIMDDAAGTQIQDIYASPALTRKARQRDGDRGQKGDTEDSGQLEEVRGEMEEREVDIYGSMADVRRSDVVPGPQEDMRDNTAGEHSQGQSSKAVRRPFKAVTVCLVMLCLMQMGGIIGLVMYYNSAINPLHTNLTQGRDLLNNPTLTLARCNNVLLERDQLLNNLTLTLTRYNNITLQRNLLQSEVNKLKGEIADKSCSSGWQKSGDVFYYISTEEKTWEESRLQCEMMGARLVVIDSQDKQEFFKGLKCWKGASHTWIGLKNKGDEWKWVDETTLRTGYWGAGYPVDHAGSCAYYWPADEKWKNMQCSQTNSWICEKTYKS